MSSVTIRKRKNKKGYSYQLAIDYSNNHSDMEYMTFSTHEEAKKMKVEIESQLNQNTYIKPCKYTFSELLDKWSENKVNSTCDDDTGYGYSLINKKYLKPILGHIPIVNLTVEILDNYFKYIRADEDGPKLSYQTARNHKTNISGALTYAVKNRWLKENIAKYSTIPKTEEEKAEDYVDDISNINSIDDLYTDKKRAITPEQAVTLLNIFKDTCLLLPVGIAMLLDLRRSEICGLLKQKVNKEKQILLVNATVIRGKNGLQFKKKNKSKKSRRPFYIPNVLMQILEIDEERKRINKELLGDKYIESDYVCTLDDGTPMKPDYLSRNFTRLLNEYISAQKEHDPDFDFPQITLHELRHFNLSLLLCNGVDLFVVKDAAGHSDINTTMIYAHTNNQSKKQVANKVDEIFTPLMNSSNF